MKSSHVVSDLILVKSPSADFLKQNIKRVNLPAVRVTFDCCHRYTLLVAPPLSPPRIPIYRSDSSLTLERFT